MESFIIETKDVMPDIIECIDLLDRSERLLLKHAKPPELPGVYIFYDPDGNILYIGEAKGKKGLCDRITKKHISGDESHCLQNFYKEKFPDRMKRREFIKRNISVKWAVSKNALIAQAVERILICAIKPKLNKL